jgi:predicted signal transduction protein with EAL and GGDEF domain
LFRASRSGPCAPENAPDVDSLVRNADRALYWGKDSGRNMTFLYTDEALASFSLSASRPTG